MGSCLPSVAVREVDDVAEGLVGDVTGEVVVEELGDALEVPVGLCRTVG
jgi:hypothetical protein